GLNSPFLYLVGVLHPEDWEMILSGNLSASSRQVFTKSIEIILRYGTPHTQLAALETVERLSRERIAAAGRAARAIGMPVVPTLVAFLRKPRNRRMTFEVVHALRAIRYAPGNAGGQLEIDSRAERHVLRWILGEIGSVYRDADIWWRYYEESGRKEIVSGLAILESALRERTLRVAEWALDVTVLLDKEGLITWGRRDLDMREYAHRLDMIEILESLGSHRIGAMTVPLLKFESWERVARSGKSF
ncbi:unnamed protein product, partial [marine sediment metagenome]